VLPHTFAPCVAIVAELWPRYAPSACQLCEICIISPSEALHALSIALDKPLRAPSIALNASTSPWGAWVYPLLHLLKKKNFKIVVVGRGMGHPRGYPLEAFRALGRGLEGVGKGKRGVSVSPPYYLLATLTCHTYYSRHLAYAQPHHEGGGAQTSTGWLAQSACANFLHF
jgi:hypothetical protein